MLKIQNLVKRYQQDTLALDHVSFEMKENEILGILGPNGCGKTTLIHCALGLLSYEKGEITILGDKLTNQSRKQIGIVPQDLALLEALSVEENIDFFCGLYINDKKLRKQYVNEALQFVQLEEYRKKNIKKLSGGLKRRVNIACGIVHKPKLIFLDEPTVAVDPQSRNFILDGLKQLKQQGANIVYTTHYMEEAEILCDRIIIMDKAQILSIGTKQEIMQQHGISQIIKINIHDKNFVLPIGIRHYKANEYIFEKPENLEHLLNKLNKENISYEIIEMLQPTLNDIFLLLTGKSLRDEA